MVMFLRMLEIRVPHGPHPHFYALTFSKSFLMVAQWLGGGNEEDDKSLNQDKDKRR